MSDDRNVRDERERRERGAELIVPTVDCARGL